MPSRCDQPQRAVRRSALMSMGSSCSLARSPSAHLNPVSFAFRLARRLPMARVPGTSSPSWPSPSSRAAPAAVITSAQIRATTRPGYSAMSVLMELILTTGLVSVIWARPRRPNVGSSAPRVAPTSPGRLWAALFGAHEPRRTFGPTWSHHVHQLLGLHRRTVAGAALPWSSPSSCAAAVTGSAAGSQGELFRGYETGNPEPATCPFWV